MRPPDPPTFYLDECLDKVLERLFLDSGLKFETPESLGIAEGTEDAVWLSTIGKLQLVLVTKDKRIKRNSSERTALETAGVAAFMLSGKDLCMAGIVKAVKNALPTMLRHCRKLRRPFIAMISQSGDVRVDLDNGRWGGARRDEEAA